MPSCFDVDDLISAGYVALVEAATRYRPGAHGDTPFSAYARMRIRGAMLDAVRAIWCDGEGRRLRRQLPECVTLIDESAHPRQLATRLEAAVDSLRMAARLAEAISWLPPAEQAVLATYYGADEPTLDDVARRLRLTHGYTRKLHSRAIEGIRRRLRVSGIAA